MQEKLEQLTVIIETLKEVVDAANFLTPDDILIQKTDNGLVITGYYDTTPVQEVIEHPRGMPISDQGNEEERITLCRLVPALKEMLWYDISSSGDFRVRCGLKPNSEDELDKLHELVDEKTLNQLNENGYTIIKEVHD